MENGTSKQGIILQKSSFKLRFEKKSDITVSFSFLLSKILKPEVSGRNLNFLKFYTTFYLIFSHNYQFYLYRIGENLSMNNITIIGRLSQDPTVGKSKSNGEPVTLFNIASDSSIPNKTDFIHCMANYQTGKYVAQYGAKGMTIYAEGELTTGEHTNMDGVKVPNFTIMVRKVKFLSKNPKQQQSGQTQHPQQQVPTPQGNGNYQQRPAQQQGPQFRNSAPIYQEVCRGGQQQSRNGFTPGGNGNYPAPPKYQQPKTDFLEVPDMEDCPFN